MVFSWNQYMKKNQAKGPMSFYNTRTECYFQKFTLTLFTVWYFAKYALTYFLRKLRVFFRETNYLIASIVKQIFKNCKFDNVKLTWLAQICAKMSLVNRKHKGSENSNQLKPLHRTVQKGNYLCHKLPKFNPRLLSYEKVNFKNFNSDH